jgi:hypothetical protein
MMRHLVNGYSGTSPARENHAEHHPVLLASPIPRLGRSKAVSIILDA